MRKVKCIIQLKIAFSLMAAFLMTLPAMALGQKELQQLLDGQTSTTTRASADGFTEIDISGYTEPFTSTLYVRSQNIRFVNPKVG